MRSGDERNYARVLERLQPSRTASKPHEKNIEALRRELAQPEPLSVRFRSRPRAARHRGGRARRRLRRALRQPGGREPARHRREEPARPAFPGSCFSNARRSSAALREAQGDPLGLRRAERDLSALGREPLPLTCVVTRIDATGLALLVELRADRAAAAPCARGAPASTEQQANRELIRNLAHEIKNPLGGLRGAAQLLERELDKPELREYTQVIIKEADRLQALVDRMLDAAPRAARRADVSIHEVLRARAQPGAGRVPGVRDRARLRSRACRDLAATASS